MPVWRNCRTGKVYHSSMCSNACERLAQICQAIDELAGDRRTGRAAAPDPGVRGDAAGGPGRRRGTAGGLAERGAPAPEGGQALAADDLAGRLAAVWAIVADADPELAKRVAGYLDAAG